MSTQSALWPARCGGAFLLAFLLAAPRLALAQGGFTNVGSYPGAVISITSPANHANFFSPVDIPIFARVVDAIRTTNVEFYAGTNDLGPGVNLGRAGRPVSVFGSLWQLTEPVFDTVYCLIWTNPAPGSYRLTAVNLSPNLYNSAQYITQTSAPVSITVTASTAPTNGPDVVSIVATDPVAVSGTNSWVWKGPTNVTPVWSNWPPRVWQSYTNWGPKDAIFTVRRFGNALAPIVINYAISGTATNGTNYAPLPGSVTIGAGAAYALIPVVPIDTAPPYSPKTVILTLSPDTNSTPAYSLGFPRSAAAVIVHDWIRPYLPSLLPGGNFHLNAAGPDGAWFSVQSSTDLQNWTTISTNQIFQGSIDFVDMNPSGNSVHFYQAMAQTNAATQ